MVSEVLGYIFPCPNLKRPVNEIYSKIFAWWKTHCYYGANFKKSAIAC